MRADLFSPNAVSTEVAFFNREMEGMLAHRPGLWDIGVQQARATGFMPSAPSDPRSWDVEIGEGLKLHVVPADQPKGVLLHVHGGGFVLGGAANQDPILCRIAENVGVTCVSVEYRLAPEHPYPAAWDDCEAAALWLIDHALERFGAEPLLIAGESAGALLAAATLIRVRDRGKISRFKGAALSFGVFDLSMTPSQRMARSGVLKGPDIARNKDTVVPDVERQRDPDVSPLYADLGEMPPALFTVGTLDAMRDDSMFMYSRWIAAGRQAELALYPGADHAFIEMPHPLAAGANARIDAFLAACLENA